MRFTPQDEEFRAEVRAWLDASLTGEFAACAAPAARAASMNGTRSGWPGTGTWPRRAGPA